MALVVLLAAQPAPAVELWSSPDGARYWALDAALKWTSLVYPERWSSASLWRGRLALGAQPAQQWHVRVAYEQRARSVSEGAGIGGGAGILPPETGAPYRLRPIDRALVDVGSTFSLRHELDRALVVRRLGSGEVQIGRQAIGWGRGVLFGAVAALGESVDASAFVGRVQGYVGEVDGEVLVGRRRRDLFAGVAASLPVKGAEVHGEWALFATPEPVLERDKVFEVLLGGSYAWDICGGLLLLGEYHYSGWGTEDIEDLTAHLADATYRERIFRGDAQIAGRHAGGLQLSRGFGSALPLSAGWIFAPTDGSGVLTALATWVFSDAVTLAASGYWPYGDEPTGAVLRSEYGGVARSGLLQISFYY